MKYKDFDVDVDSEQQQLVTTIDDRGQSELENIFVIISNVSLVVHVQVVILLLCTHAYLGTSSSGNRWSTITFRMGKGNY